MLSTYKDTHGYKFCDCTDRNSKVNQLIELLQDSEVQAFLKFFIDGAIATSDLRILKRLSAVESTLGLNAVENDIITIPERIEKLEVQVNSPTCDLKSTVELPKSLPTTVTDHRTDFLIKHLQESEDTPKVPSRGIELPYINSREFKAFLSNILPEKLRPKSYKNLRKIKKDIFENAAERYGNLVMIDKSKYGNKEIRLVALPSVTG